MIDEGRAPRISASEIRAAVNGDREAFSRLCSTLDAIAGQMSMRLRCRSSPSLHVDWSDLQQEVMLRVARHLPQFRGSTGGQLVTWLHRLVKNCFADAVGRGSSPLGSHPESRSAATLPEEFDAPDERDLPLEEILRKEQGDALWRAIGALPERSRELLGLRWLEELSFEEIARRLAFPSATAARSAYWRTVHGLPALLARLEPSARKEDPGFS